MEKDQTSRLDLCFTGHEFVPVICTVHIVEEKSDFTTVIDLREGGSFGHGAWSRGLEVGGAAPRQAQALRLEAKLGVGYWNDGIRP